MKHETSDCRLLKLQNISHEADERDTLTDKADKELHETQSSTAHLIAQSLATRAFSDHQRESLLKAVAFGKAYEDEFEKFQSQLNELKNSMLQTRKNSTWNSFPFMRLPPEVRNIIYHYLLVSPNSLHWWPCEPERKGEIYFNYQVCQSQAVFRQAVQQVVVRRWTCNKRTNRTTLTN